MFFSHQSSIGIDIADRTIEIAELREENKKIIVVSTGRASIPEGVVERGIIKNAPLLRTAIESACQSAAPFPIHPTHVVLSSPESQTFVHIFTLLSAKATELSQILSEEVTKSIPLDSKDLIYTYRMIGEREVLVAATGKSVLSAWEKFFYDMNIEVDSFDLESQAIFRSVYAEYPATPIALCDWGGAGTLVSVFANSHLSHSHVISSGGDNLLNMLVKELGINEVEAEKQKITVGLAYAESKTFQVVRKFVDPILLELAATLEYSKEKISAPVSEIVFTGGMSRMPGLVEYASRHLPIPVRIGTSYFQSGSESFNQDSFLYVEAIGLALRGWFKNEIGFSSIKSSRGWFHR